MLVGRPESLRKEPFETTDSQNQPLADPKEVLAHPKEVLAQFVPTASDERC